MKPSVFGAIGGGLIGLCAAIAGYMLAGISGEIAGVCIGVIVALFFGLYVGGRS